MNIAKDNQKSFDTKTGLVIKKSRLKRHKTKKCKRPGCETLISNHKNKEYCSEARCVAFRDMEKYGPQGRPDAASVYPKTINVIMPRNRGLSGQVIKIQCSAIGPKGQCSNTTEVRYTCNRSRYPKYCPEHRNEYQRKRFEEGKL